MTMVLKDILKTLFSAYIAHNHIQSRRITEIILWIKFLLLIYVFCLYEYANK
jgi:multisubunit Na+/H+ antiporter MnhB subunit